MGTPITGFITIFGRNVDVELTQPEEDFAQIAIITKQEAPAASQ